jgi:hypothetical protein
VRAPQPQHDRPGSCRRCGYHMHPPQAGGRYHRGRQLCNFCHPAAARNGELVDFERQTRVRDEVMADWELLRSQGFTRRQAAARLGMTVKAFEKAHERARRAGDPRALPSLDRTPPGGRRGTEAA